MESIKALALEWIRLDRNHDTRREIRELLDQQKFQELEPLLTPRLTFGTAGLRARMGAGFSRLNCLTIIQTSQGLADYLLDEDVRGGVVIGYDARHNSKTFAECAAAVFIDRRIPVRWYDEVVHTPMVPFAVERFDAAAGIMITASHNPKEDNGYKVYGSNACLINSPETDRIADAIMDNLEPETWKLGPERFYSGLFKPIDKSLRTYYLSMIHQAMDTYPKTAGLSIDFVYTPMHGVGLVPMEAILKEVKSRDRMVVVREQAQPDADFPTVIYPNPEETGALDLAKATADQQGLRLILANDPDADRFAVAEKLRDGSWHQFTGDQIGILLADYVTKGVQPRRTWGDWVLTTAVSSQMLEILAGSRGLELEVTLTGFKWLGNQAMTLNRCRQCVHFAYEEALGYMFPGVVHDKDGIAAAAIFLRACKGWPSCSPWERLQELYRDYGYFHTINTYWRSPNMAATSAVFDHVRRSGDPYPKRVGPRAVVRWRDLTVGYDSGTEDHIPKLPVSKDSQMITCWLDKIDGSDEGIRFTVRTSGTEPKIKIYLECHARDAASAEKGATQMLEHIKLEWFNDPCLVMEEKKP